LSLFVAGHQARRSVYLSVPPQKTSTDMPYHERERPCRVKPIAGCSLRARPGIPLRPTSSSSGGTHPESHTNPDTSFVYSCPIRGRHCSLRTVRRERGQWTSGRRSSMACPVSPEETLPAALRIAGRNRERGRQMPSDAFIDRRPPGFRFDPCGPHRTALEPSETPDTRT